MILGNKFSITIKWLTVLYIGVHLTWWGLAWIELTEKIYTRVHGPLGLLFGAILIFFYWKLGKHLWERMARRYVSEKIKDDTLDQYTYLMDRWMKLLIVEYLSLGFIIMAIVIAKHFTDDYHVVWTDGNILFLLAVSAGADNIMKKAAYGRWVKMIKAEFNSRNASEGTRLETPR